MTDISMYQSLFNLLHNHIYGGVDLTSDMNLVLTLISTFGVIFLISLPFFAVFLFLYFVFSNLRFR